ncbi:hypothetical protein G9A89_000866 [Geosiphon pyriformis]|nr:hypothetical protein G9A89_000866 [Geosiphon pyriformis]
MVTDSEESLLEFSKKFLEAAFGSDSSTPELGFSHILVNNTNNNNTISNNNSKDTNKTKVIDLLAPLPVPTLTISSDSKTLQSKTVKGNKDFKVSKDTEKTPEVEFKRSSTDSATSTQTTESTSSAETNDTENTFNTVLIPESPLEIRVTSSGVSEMTLKRRSIMGSDDEDSMQDVADELLIHTSDPSHLFWVPAHMHPEIAPNEFRKWLQNHAKEGFNTGPNSLRRRKSALSRQYIPPENEDSEKENLSSIEAKESIRYDDGFDWESYGSSDGTISPSVESSRLNILRRSLSLNLPPFMESCYGSNDPNVFDRHSSPYVDSNILVRRMVPALKRAARTKIRRNSVAGEHNPHRFSAHRRTKSTHFISERQNHYGVTGMFSHNLTHSMLKNEFKELSNLAEKPSLISPESPIVINKNQGNSILPAKTENKDVELDRIALKDSSDLIRITLKDNGSQPKNKTVTPSPRRTSSLSTESLEVTDALQEGRLPISEQARLSLNTSILLQKNTSERISPTQTSPSPSIKRSITWSSWLRWSGGNSDEKDLRARKSKLSKDAKFDRDSKSEKEATLDNNIKMNKESDTGINQTFKVEDGDNETLEIENEEIVSVKEKPKMSLASLFSWNSTNKGKAAEETTTQAIASTSNTATSVNHRKPKYSNYNRMPIHVERAIYRLSHVKLANPRRPLHEQVLISNMMFWYLSLINKQQEEYGGGNPNAQKEVLKVKSKVGKGGRGKRQKRNNKQNGPSRRGSEVAYKAPQYDMQQAQIAQQYLSPPSSPSHSGAPYSNGPGTSLDYASDDDDHTSDEEFSKHTYHHYNNGYTSDGTDGGYLDDSIIKDDGSNVGMNKQVYSDNDKVVKENGGSKTVNSSHKRPSSPNPPNGRLPVGRPPSPNGRSSSSSQQRAPSPNGRPVSPNGRPVSPNGRPVSPNGRPTPMSSGHSSLQNSRRSSSTHRGVNGGATRTRLSTTNNGPRVIVKNHSELNKEEDDDDDDDEVPLGLAKKYFGDLYTTNVSVSTPNDFAMRIPSAAISDSSVKRRSARVLSTGSVGGGLTQNVKKSLGNIKPLSANKNLKDSGSVCMNRQFASMNTDGEASDDNGTSDSQMNMPNVKCFNTGAAISSLIGSISYDMDDEEEVFLPLHLFFSLEKSQVEVVVKKSFALDINLSTVEEKSAMAKTQTASLAKENNIVVNSNLKRQGVCSDWAVVIKEILMNMPKEMIIAAVSKFGQVVSIQLQLIRLWQKTVADQLAAKWSFLIRKDSVRVAKAVGDYWYRVLLFTLPVGTTAHNLGDLLVGADTGNRICCAVVCFENDEVLESAFCTEPIFGGMRLSWARLDMIRCKQCGKLDHSVLECNAVISTSSALSKSFKRIVSDENHFQLAKLYVKKSVPISKPAAFSSKSWTQVVFLVSSSNGPYFGSSSGLGSFSGALGVTGHSSPADPVSSFLETCLTFLEHFLKLLTDKVSGIIDKLDNLNLVSLVLASSSQPLVVPGLIDVKFGLDMVLNEPKFAVLPPSLVSSSVSSLGSSSSKILTSIVGCLESKLMALEASVCSVLEKLDQMCAGSGFVVFSGNEQFSKQEDIICWHKDMNNLVSIVTKTKLKDKVQPWIANKFDNVRVFVSGLNSGYLDSSVVIIMNNALTKHVCKVFKVPGHLLSVKLLFKNRLSVSILGLYAGASVSVCFLQVDEINSLIAKAVNKSSFMILGGNFNKDSSYSVTRIDEYFDTDHRVVIVFMGLGGLLNVNLMFLHKQMNKNCWKFNFKDAMAAKWAVFKKSSAATTAMLKYVIHKIVCLLANDVFKKKWFKGYDNVFTKESSKFHKLELLVSKLVKASCLVSSEEFVALLGTWNLLDATNASVVESHFFSELHFEVIRSVLFRVRKLYHFSKLSKSKCAEESRIRSAVSKKMESFEVNKSHTIRSVLEHPFHKVVLDYLVANDELVLESSLVKSKYQPLEYVFDNAFSGIMDPISSVELLGVVSDLLNDKAAGLSVKRQEEFCEYKLNSHFIAKTGCVESQAGFSFFFAASAFVDDTIWVGSSQTITQHILNVASEFFRINDISINNDKTVAIPINCRVVSLFLTISGAPISIAKKEGPHWYLGIFLSMGGLSKPSLAKMHSDIQFFTNLVLKKAISDKQFSYLVSAVLYLIIQAESKSVSIVCFANAVRILGHLFLHRSHDLQTLSWHPVHLLVSLACLNLNPLNNFLAGVVHIFADCSLSFSSLGPSAFQFSHGTLMSLVIGETFKHWKRLDPRGTIPDWFSVSVGYLGSAESSSSVHDCSVGIFFAPNVLESTDFDLVCSQLLGLGADSLSVYTDGSLAGLDTLSVKLGVAVFFDDINMGLDVKILGLLSSTLAELQAIALTFECVSAVSKVCLFLDSQVMLDACRSELGLAHPNFWNSCWVEHHHIANFICAKRLDADELAGCAAFSDLVLPSQLDEQFILAGSSPVSGNSRHFVCNIYQSIHHSHWGFGSGTRVVTGELLSDINWCRSSSVWHPNSHMAVGFTSKRTAGLCTYFIKALYHRLPVAVCKCLYDRSYPSVICLYCGCVEILDHVFSCDSDFASHGRLLGDFAVKWEGISGLHCPSSYVLQTFSSCVFDISVCVALCKGFVFNDWFFEAVSVFGDLKLAGVKIVDFVHDFCLAFRDKIWLVCVKHHAFMEKHGLIPRDGSMPVSISGLSSLYLAGVVRLLGIDDALDIRFGLHKFSLFISGALNVVSVHIGT